MRFTSRRNWNLEMLVFMEGGKPENPEKDPRSKGENQQQTQPTCDTGAGNRTRATLVGGECSYHCAIPAPTYHREQEIKRQLDHLDVFICNDFFSVHIDQVLQEYDNLKTELRSSYEDKGKQAMCRAKCRWVENGERPTKYFFNPEKRNYNKKL